MAAISREVAVRRKPLEWRPGPPTPYPLLPASRRLEWLAFIATPVGGILAVVDRNSAGGLCTFLVLVALVLFAVPIAIREGFCRLPLTLARALFAIIAGTIVIFILAVATMLALGSPIVLATCLTGFGFYGLVFWLLRDRAPA